MRMKIAAALVLLSTVAVAQADYPIHLHIFATRTEKEMDITTSSSGRSAGGDYEHFVLSCKADDGTVYGIRPWRAPSLDLGDYRARRLNNGFEIQYRLKGKLRHGHYLIVEAFKE